MRNEYLIKNRCEHVLDVLQAEDGTRFLIVKCAICNRIFRFDSQTKPLEFIEVLYKEERT